MHFFWFGHIWNLWFCIEEKSFFSNLMPLFIWGKQYTCSALHHMQGKKVLSFAWLQKNVFMSNNRLRKLHYESVISQRSSWGGAWRIILGNFPFYSSKVMLWILVGDHTVHGTFSCMQFPWDFSHHAFSEKELWKCTRKLQSNPNQFWTCSCWNLTLPYYNIILQFCKISFQDWVKRHMKIRYCKLKNFFCEWFVWWI